MLGPPGTVVLTSFRGRMRIGWIANDRPRVRMPLGMRKGGLQGICHDDKRLNRGYGRS